MPYDKAFMCFLPYTEVGSNDTTTSSPSSDPLSTITLSSSVPPSTTQPTPILPQSIIIAIAVSGSVLTLAIAMVIIAILMCCLLCSRKRKTTAIQGPAVGNGNGQTQENLVNNPAYNVENTNDWLVNNPAYNSNQLTHNPAYDCSGDTEPYYTVIRD